MIELVLFLAVFLLAFSNGANDVSKGIATLVGSGTASIARATVWGVVATALGSFAAFVFGGLLLNVFSKGLLSEGFDPARIALAVAVSASLWVLTASRLGLPVSTTHAIVGAIIGAGVASFGVDGVSWSGVEKKALLPLLISPFASFGISYSLFPFVSKRFASSKERCLCIEHCEVVPATSAFAFSIPVISIVGIGVASGNGVQWKVVRDILIAWLVTLPTAGIAAYAIQRMPA